MTTTAALDPTFERIQSIIAKAAKLPKEAVVATNAVTGLQNVDSIVLLEIVARVEVELGIDIDENLLFDVQTVGDFVDVCRRLRSGPNAQDEQATEQGAS